MFYKTVEKTIKATMAKSEAEAEAELKFLKTLELRPLCPVWRDRCKMDKCVCYQLGFNTEIYEDTWTPYCKKYRKEITHV